MLPFRPRLFSVAIAGRLRLCSGLQVNGAFLRNVMGAVDGTQRSADLLMEAGECVFVYPVRLYVMRSPLAANDGARLGGCRSPTNSRCAVTPA